jgi:hypothetical protein
MMRISRAWVVGFIIKLSSSKEKGSRRKNWEKCLATALPIQHSFFAATTENKQKQTRK